jgi:hypothetical protein
MIKHELGRFCSGVNPLVLFTSLSFLSKFIARTRVDKERLEESHNNKLAQIEAELFFMYFIFISERKNFKRLFREISKSQN